MGRTCIGIAIGVVATWLVLGMSESGQEDVTQLTENSYEDPDPVTRAATSSSATQLPVVADSNSSTDAQGSELTVEDGKMREAQLQESIANARSVLSELEKELRKIGADRARANQPILSRLVLGPEFDWLQETPYFNEYDAIQRESVDPVWASMVEEELNSYFLENSQLIDEFGIPEVHCRTNRCGVAFMRSGVEESQSDLAWSFRELVSDFDNHPWPDEFVEPLGLDVHSADGVSTVYFGLGLRDRLNAMAQERAQDQR